MYGHFGLATILNSEELISKSVLAFVLTGNKIGTMRR